jgi:hypothetical protein
MRAHVSTSCPCPFCFFARVVAKDVNDPNVLTHHKTARQRRGRGRSKSAIIDEAASRLSQPRARSPIIRRMSAGTLFGLLMVGILVGVASGMLGIGGGVIVIPILVAVFRFSHTHAVGTSLAMLLPPIGIFAFLEYYRSGNVNLAAAGALAAGFAVGAYFGAKLITTKVVPEETLRMFFAFFLLYIAGNILFRHQHRVWAALNTIVVMATFALSYVALRAVGKRWERKFSVEREYLPRLGVPLAPDYEI